MVMLWFVQEAERNGFDPQLFQPLKLSAYILYITHENLEYLSWSLIGSYKMNLVFVDMMRN